MRALYQYRKRRLAARAGKIEDDGYEDRSLAYQQMLQLILWAQRDALLQMRIDHKLSNEVMNKILRELDLEELRLETSIAPPTTAGIPEVPQRHNAPPRFSRRAATTTTPPLAREAQRDR
jgi:hypothetical protein